MAARRVLEVDAVVDSAKLAAGFRRMGSAAEKFGKDASRAGVTGSRGLDRLGKSAQATGRHLKGMSPGLAGAIGGFTSLAGAAALLKDSVKQTESLAKGTVLLARTTGESTQEASRWVAVARSRGVEAVALNRSFVALSKNIKAATDGGDKQIETFKRLGVSQQELKRGDVSQIIGDISDAFARMPDGAQKAATAQQLFGRQAQTLVPMLNKGSAALREQLALSDKYGTTLSRGQVAQSLKAVQAQRELNLAMTGLKVQLGQAVIPALTVGITKVTAFVAQMRSGEGAGGRFAEKLKDIWKGAKPVVEQLGKIVTAVGKFAAAHPGLTKVAGALLAAGVAVKTITFASQITGIGKLIRLAGTLGSVGASGGASMAARMLSAFRTRFGTGKSITRQVGGVLLNAGSDGGAAAGGAAASKLGSKFKTSLPAAVKGIAASATWAAIGSAIGAVMAAAIMDQIGQKLQDALSGGANAGGNPRAPHGNPTQDAWSVVRDALGFRSGGRVFQSGGTVPALVSSGEVIVEPGGSAWRAPGPPVAADNVPAMLKPGSAVLTWDGQARMMAGQSLASAVATQAPHFKDGGYAFHREPVGYGNHTHAGRGLAVPRSSTHGRSLGRFLTTAYGPPWDAIEGGGITSTGVKLTQGIQKFVVAVDPGVIGQHTPLNIWPNPFNDPGRVFWSEDTGGAIRGKHIDIFHAAADGTKDRWNKNATVWLAGTERGPGANSAGGRTLTKSTYAPPSPGTRRSSRASFDSGYEQGVSDPFGYGLAQHRTDFYNQARGSIFGTWTTTKRTSPSRPSRRRAAPTSGGGVVSDAKAILASGNTRFPLRLETGGTARRDFESIVSHGDGQAYVPHTGRWTPVKRSLMDALASMAGSGGTWINALTGGNHSNGSHHYSGTAVDLDLGSPLGAGRIQSIARRFGGARNYETSHIHLDFRRGGRVQRFGTGTRSVSKAGGSWSGAPRNPHGDRNAAYQTLWRYINLGIGKNDQGKVKSALAQELRLIDRLDYNELRFFARDLKRVYAGPWPSTAVGRTEQARVSQLIKYTDDAIGRNLGRATGVTESVQEDISGISGRIENQLKLAGIDPEGADGRRIIAAADTSAIGRLQGRRGALAAARTRALRAGRRDVAASITGKITEVDDQILGLKVAIQDLTSTVGDATATAEQQLEQQRQTNELLQGQLDGVRKAMNVSQSQYGVLAKAIADIASGQIGGMLGLAVQSAGTPGVVARY